MRKDTIKPLYILIALLFTAVLVQGYFIYDLQQENSSKKDEASLTYLPVLHRNGSMDPFVQMQKIQEHMMKEFGNFNSMFANDPFFQDSFSNARFSPVSDIIEEDKAYILEVKIPGVDEQKIEINNDGNMIHIAAQSQRSSDKNSTNYIYKESFGHYFKRSFTLPNDADFSSMKSSYKDGILKITIQKKRG
jgi:HSP20 family protein